MKKSVRNLSIYSNSQYYPPSDSSSIIWLTKLISSLGLISIPFNVSTKLRMLFQSSVDFDSISKYNWNFPEAPFLVSICTIFFSFAWKWIDITMDSKSINRMRMIRDVLFKIYLDINITWNISKTLDSSGPISLSSCIITADLYFPFGVR